MVYFLAVATSLRYDCSLRTGIAQDWGHHPRPPDYQDWSNRSLLEKCAHHWDYINSIGYRKVATICQVTRLETMIHGPLAFARSICRQLTLREDRYRKDLMIWAKSVQNTNNQHFVEAQTSKLYS